MKLPSFISNIFKKKPSDDSEEDIDDDFGEDLDEQSDEVITDQPDEEAVDKTDEETADASDEDFEPEIEDAFENEYEDDREGEPKKLLGLTLDKKTLIFIAAGTTALVLGIGGGVGYWMYDSGTDTASTHTDITSGKRVDIALLKNDSEDQSAVPTEVSDTTGAAYEKDQPADQQGLPGDFETTEATDFGGGLNTFAGSAGPGRGVVIPSTTASSFKGMPDLPEGNALPNSPNKNMLQALANGDEYLPSLGPNGETSWEVYGRPTKADKSLPRVAIMVTGLGLSRAATMAAIKKLPPDVSLAFSPYAKDLNDWVIRARRAGHEVFVELPMESADYPTEDAGPYALSSDLEPEENMGRLMRVLSRFVGYTGVISTMGSRFTTDKIQMKPILTFIKKRGLMFVDGTTITESVAPGIARNLDLPSSFSNMIVDEVLAKTWIDNNLEDLTILANKNAVAIATVGAYPINYERLNHWISLLGAHQVALVPISATVNKQFLREEN